LINKKQYYYFLSSG